MAHLLASLKDYFELEETNIDNWAFKLFYKVSCGLCMVGATIGVASQYFGEPIRYHQRAAMDHLTLGAPILGDKNSLLHVSVASSMGSMEDMQKTTVGCMEATTSRRNTR